MDKADWDILHSELIPKRPYIRDRAHYGYFCSECGAKLLSQDYPEGELEQIKECPFCSTQFRRGNETGS